ncbi:hypothetical protein Clacol_009262 [Clathrus columnatus]|uniref:Uncharacterized protein n=1 Tax=Clathrus columnatus TaxID=1419009 RepID=A0AAV5AMH9_9AGAM|nr:hypothetical protein Clacol_009262 [Clathrus columnatus]
MLLAQKPQSINFRHRRQPASLSALTVVPHPTNAPGLFAIAKPIRQQPRPHPRSQSPRCPPRGRLHRSQHQPSQPLLISQSPAAEHISMDVVGKEKIQSTPFKKSALTTAISDNHDASTMSHPQQAPDIPPLAFGAQSTGRYPRTRRSRHKSTPAVSASDPPSDSVPVQHSVVPEGLISLTVPEKNKMIPSTPPRVVSPTCPPLLPSAPIIIPERRRGQSPSFNHQMSKSEPGKTKLSIQTVSPAQPPKSTRKRRKNKTKRPQDGLHLPLAEWDFPARESDEDEAEDEEPSTPTRQTSNNNRSWLNDGPKTAPLDPSPQQFPFFTFPTRASPLRAKTPITSGTSPFPITPGTHVTPLKQIRPGHRRAPSQPASLNRGMFADGVFHFSEDEGDRSPAALEIEKKMALLFGKKLGSEKASLPSSVPPLFSASTPSPRRKVTRERESPDAGRQLFASSSFQIAPEPVDLPTPSFMLSRSKLQQ